MKVMKQAQVATQLGISKSYLSMILSGKRQASNELAERIRSQSSQNRLNSIATPCLEGRNSTTELLPQ